MYKNAEYIFRFIGDVWQKMPLKDKELYAEMWRGFEQVFADQLQRGMELDLSTAVETCPVYVTSRWNRYYFNENTELLVPATYLSTWDISEGVNLSTRFMFAFKVDGVRYEADLRGPDPTKTTLEEIIFRINAATGFKFAAAALNDATLQFTTRSVGPLASIEFVSATVPALDCTPDILGSVPATKFPVYPFRYSLPAANIWEIPRLQNAIRPDNTTKVLSNLNDYVLEPGQFIAFKKRPAEMLWAKATRLNEKTPAYNFGWLIDYVDSSLPPSEYLLTLQGLWYAYWMGPRPEFIRRALYLLFGLPVARQPGVVTGVTVSSGLATAGSISILETDSQLEVTYPVPPHLTPLVKYGDAVERFQPLVDGIEVYDKVNRPGFVETDIGRNNIQRFLTEDATRGLGDTDETKALRLLEEHTYLPQINVFAFTRNVDLSIVRTFLDSIRPLTKAYHFQIVVANLSDALAIQDKFGWHLDFTLNPNLDANPYTATTPSIRSAYESGGPGDFYLDSEGIVFGERGSITVRDRNGPRPDLSRSW